MTQRSDAHEARTHNPSVSSQTLYRWATALPENCDVPQFFAMCINVVYCRKPPFF